ncbi:MAG: ABC transporter permease [Clostridia bacterium]|nr:ABC transporter permease [Clostridia bacterium]
MNIRGRLGRFAEKCRKHQFLFEELVKRDFKQKYKRTVLGMGWSILSPLLTLLVMRLVFTQFFGRNTSHYTTYLFAGNLVFSFFKESTTGGMSALMGNKHIFTKINVPKYIFLLTKNVSSIINFGLTLCVFFLFAALDGITFRVSFLALLFPIACLIVFNIGVGLILSALFVFFRDISYLYDIFTLLLMYMSAIFYQVDAYAPAIQRLFYINPLYCVITYVRTVVIDGVIPGPGLHLLIVFYAAVAMLLGGLMYKKKNHKFLYYV